MLEANIGVAEDLLSIRSLLSAGIELSKNRDAVPPAEQTLRTAVLLRKVGCCNRSEKGIKSFENLTSLFATFAKRGKDFKDWIKERLIGPGLKFVPPILLPDDFSTKILLS